MKKHAKKALKHDVEVLGKTVPTLAIAALFLVGGGTAATLTYFGQVTGTANVDQAVVVDSPGETTVNIFDSNEPITAGETVVDTFEITNNMDSDYNPVYDSDLVVDDSGESSTYEDTGASVDWQNDEDNQVGIDTTYANYFSDAGHNFSAVEVDADITVDDDSGSNDDSDTEYATISEALSNAGSDDVIYVENHSSDGYDSFTVATSGVTLASNGATVDSIEVNADNVDVEGFHVQGEGSDSSGADGINIEGTTGVTVANNLVEDIEAGIYVDNSDATVEDNTVKDNFAGVAGTEGFTGSIDYNIFKSNDEAIGVGSDNFATEGNRFEDNTVTFKVYDSSTSDYDSQGSTVDADNNFFAEPFNIAYNGNEGVTDVSTSYQTVDSVPAGETVKVGVVNEFDLMIDGSSDYTLTTDITMN